jgi:iron(III) transport system substrate-binding protein
MRNRNHRLLLATLACSALVLTGCGSGGGDDVDVAAANAMSVDELKAKAADEGAVSWFTTMYPTETAQKVADAFTDKYGIKVEVERGSANETWEKFRTGMSAKSSPADVYSTPTLPLYESAKKAGYVDCYLPPSVEDLDADYKDPDGCWFASRISTFLIAYNTKNVKPDEVPQTWQDLTDPRWKGKLGLLDAATHATGYSSDYRLSEEFGGGSWEGSKDFWTAIGKNKPVLYPQAGPLANALVAGEIDVAVPFGYRAWEMKEQGAPVGIVTPKEGVTANFDYTMLVHGTDQPYAARLFMDFLGSKEAMELGAKNAYYYSVRSDVGPFPADRPALGSVKLLWPDFDGEIKDKDAWLKMWEDVVSP